MRFRRLFFLLFISLWSSFSLAAEPTTSGSPNDPSYLSQLQAQAQAQKLDQDAYWHTLLHYERQPLTRRLRSLADDPDFFNAGQAGRTDPAAELSATLAAMFNPETNHTGQQAARCRFPARWEWLREQLPIDAAQLPPLQCPAYDSWRQASAARSVTLVFPSAYVNSPASMYGHTFFRLDPTAAHTDQALLANTISYAAKSDEKNGFLFAIKGLLGAYPGTMSNEPYYLRIREYSHLENRDIWEYQLALTPREIERLQAHAWELAFTTFDYYFFDENCAYLLLTLLDAARPGLTLGPRFTWWTIPVDTVRAINDIPGLVQTRRFRPSNQTELRHRAHALSAQAQQRALALSLGSPAAGQDHDDSATLELAERLATLRAAKGELDDAGLAKLRLPLLTARAKLPAEHQAPSAPTPNVAPEAGHRTGRLELSLGHQSQHSHWRLALRPAYHDVLDPEAGYQRGAQIQFFDLAIGQQAGQKLQLESFTPVDILSLSPSALWQSGRSWKMRFGLSRAWGLPAPNAPLSVDINGGPGWAWTLGHTDAWGHSPAIAYVFLDTQAWFDRSRTNPGGQRMPWQLGAGPALGLLWDTSPKSRLYLQATYRSLLRHQNERGIRAAYRWQLDTTQNLIVNCEQKRRDKQPTQSGCALGWQRYW
jgi:hypothetical protein